jgi:hypothetical protein
MADASEPSTLPSLDGAGAAEEPMIKKEQLPTAVGDDDDDELNDDDDDEAVEAVQSQYEECDEYDEEAAPAAPEGEEGEEVVVRSELAAAAPEEVAMAAEQKTEAAGRAERQAESSSAAATSKAAAPAAAAGEEREEVVVKREAEMAAEHATEPIPMDSLKELEAAAMWADGEDVAKQFPASRWPGLDGVYWRLAHKITCDRRIISCNTKAIPDGQIIVGSIFIHVTTPQVSARTPHTSPYATRMARPEMCASALVGRLRRRGGRRLVCSPPRSGSSSVARHTCRMRAGWRACPPPYLTR